MIYLSSPIVLPTLSLPLWLYRAIWALAVVWAAIGIASFITRKQYWRAVGFFLLAAALLAPLVGVWWPS